MQDKLLKLIEMFDEIADELEEKSKTEISDFSKGLTKGHAAGYKLFIKTLKRELFEEEEICKIN